MVMAVSETPEIRDSDEPSERGDFPYYDLGPATSEAVGALDLDAVKARAADAALTCSERAAQRVLRTDVPALVAEVRRLTEALDRGGAEWSRMAQEYDALRGMAEASTAWRARAEAAEAQRDVALAKVAAVEALAERLAASLALVLYDAHPVYGSTALWHGGIGGQAITAHCAIIHGGPPGMEWTEGDLPSMALREFIAGSPGFDLDAAKAAMLADLRAALATGEGE